MTDSTTIRIKISTKERLDKMSTKDLTYDNILNKLIDDYYESTRIGFK